MKRPSSTVTGSFRAVALSITLVSIIAFSSLAYSAYSDFNAVIGGLGPNAKSPAITAKTVISGDTVTAYLNVTVTNKGLYPLDVGLTCLGNASSSVSCTGGSVSVPPGNSNTLHFSMTLSNATAHSPSLSGVKGNLSLALVPFASVSIVVDLGSLVKPGK